MRLAAPFLALTAFALSGCGSPPKPTQTSAPDSQPGHRVDCTGANWADCYEKAGAICRNRGYVILDRSPDATASAGAGAAGGGSGPTTHRSMVIECRDWSPR